MERYDLPEGWKRAAIGDPNYFTLIMGQSPPSSSYNIDGQILPFLQGKAEFGTLSPTPIKYCSLPSRIAEKKDILLSVRAPVGPTNLADQRYCIGRGLAAIRCTSKISPLCLLYYLRAIEIDIAGSVEGQGGAFTAIKRSQLESFEIPIPPIPEQHRIVKRIEELTSRLEEVRNLKAKAIEQTSSQFMHVRRKIFEDLLSVCETVPLCKCGKVMGGGTPSKIREDYWNGKIPWISAKEMKQFKLVDSVLKITSEGLNESSAKMIPANSVLFVVRGSILYRHVPVAVNTMPCTINQDMKAIIPKKGIEAEYLAHMMIGANDILRDMVEEAGNTAGKLQTPFWSAFEMPIPSPERQKRIVKWLDEYEEKLTILHKLQAETEAEIMQFTPSLLSKAFRGEL